MLGSLVALMLKEFRQTVRDPRSLMLLVMAPLLQLIVLGYAVNLDVKGVHTLLVDEDHTVASRQFLEGLTAGDTFDRVGWSDSSQEAMRSLRTGDIEVAAVVPRGFSRKLARGETASVQFLFDGVDSNRTMVAGNAARTYGTLQAITRFRQRLQAAASSGGRLAGVGAITVKPRILYNPSLDSQKFFVPGVAATVLLIVVLIVTALGIAREKESGTLEQVLVTPMRPMVLVLGKTLPYALIGLLDLGLVLSAGMLIFDVPMRGSLLLIFGGGALYVINLVAVGMFVGTLTRNQQQALIGAMFFNLPAILLSGFVTPVDNMPEWLRPWTVINPVRHFVELLRAVLLKGAHLTDLLPQLAFMAGMGIAVYVLAATLLRRSLR